MKGRGEANLSVRGLVWTEIGLFGLGGMLILMSFFILVPSVRLR